MLNKQTQKSKSESQPKPLTNNHIGTSKHGSKEKRTDLLLSLPVETLTGITSHLDPHTLIIVSKVNKQLWEHVKDDHTWHCAFACQVLGIGPEDDLYDATKSIMLRRTEGSWKREFIARYNLSRCWKLSRNVTTTHDPLHTAITSVHLMHPLSVLASSIQYGIVSRSIPLTGKVLPGYLDASGFRAGLGIGNPTTQFSPDISACALASEGGTAKVLWGFKGGDVAITTASKAMEVRKTASAELKRCQLADAHVGEVLDVVWGDAQSAVFASAGADGCGKLWDAKDVSCLWTSKVETSVPEAFVKVALAPDHGYVVGVVRSGAIHVWTGFTLPALANATITDVVIPCPCPAQAVTGEITPTREVSALFVDETATSPTILVAYRDDAYFYRMRIGKNVSETEITTFGDASFGPISIITPFFSREPSESSFVISGDHIGCINVYDWAVPAHTNTAIRPIRKFEAHEDGSSVTAIACNGTTLITGSQRGATHVWDALTFEHLRHFSSPVPKVRMRHVNVDIHDQRVNHILIPEKDVLFVAVGDRIMSWKAGPVSKIHRGGVRGRHSTGIAHGKKVKAGTAKFLQQLEINQMITESRYLLSDEKKRVPRVLGREEEQQAGLNSLGLTETEALEYVLMLSRDEMNNNSDIIGGTGAGSSQTSITANEGLFKMDFDEPSTSPPILSMRPGGPLPSPPHSRDEVSSPYKEIKEADTASEDVGSGSSVSSLEHFPLISASTSPVASPVLEPAERNKAPSSVSFPSSIVGRPQPLAGKSAWNTPLVKKSPPARTPVFGNPRSNEVGSGYGDDVDADLRLAIELSLAEA